MTRAPRSFIEVQEAQQAKLIEGLRTSGDPYALHLADKLARCRASRERLRAWGGRPVDLRDVLGRDGRYRCEHHACWSCSRKRIRGFAKKEAWRFNNAENLFCSHVTIADSVTGDLGEVRQRVAVIVRALRDRRDATAKTWARWRAVEMVGHVELDPYWPGDISNFAPDQGTLIPTLPVLSHAGDGTMWVVRIHLVVRHDEITHDELEEVFCRQWLGAGRVHVDPFYEDELAQENAGRLLSYGIKHQYEYDVGEMSESWPVSWQVEYWTWLHRMGRGLQPLRVSIGPQRPKSNPVSSILASISSVTNSSMAISSMAISSVANSSSSVPSSSIPISSPCGHDEPMPVVFGIGMFDLALRPP